MSLFKCGAQSTLLHKTVGPSALKETQFHGPKNNDNYLKLLCSVYFFFLMTEISGIYMTIMTSFENKNYFAGGYL